jgi:hypothetical protein
MYVCRCVCHVLMLQIEKWDVCMSVFFSPLPIVLQKELFKPRIGSNCQITNNLCVIGILKNFRTND